MSFLLSGTSLFLPPAPGAPVWELQPSTFAVTLVSMHSERNGTRPEVRIRRVTASRRCGGAETRRPRHRSATNCRSKRSLATRPANGAGTPPAGGLNQLHLCVNWGRQTLDLLGVHRLVFRGDELVFFWEQIQIYW